MRSQRRTVSESKHLAVRSEIERCVARGAVSSAAGVAREAGVTEPFLYRHEAQPCALCSDIFGGGPVSFYRARMAAITAARDEAVADDGARTAASLRAELANAHGTIQRLRHQVRPLERRLAIAEGAAVEAALGEAGPLGH